MRGLTFTLIVFGVAAMSSRETFAQNVCANGSCGTVIESQAMVAPAAETAPMVSSDVSYQRQSTVKRSRHKRTRRFKFRRSHRRRGFFRR